MIYKLVFHKNKKCSKYVFFIINFQFQAPKRVLSGSQTYWFPKASFLGREPWRLSFFGIFFFVGHFNGKPHCLPVPELFQLQLWTFPTTLMLTYFLHTHIEGRSILHLLIEFAEKKLAETMFAET